MKHKGCHICSFRGRRDLVEVPIANYGDFQKRIREAAKLRGMTEQQFLRHALMESALEAVAEDTGEPE